ncbi:MAG: 50S ribosomal protein L35 [Propionibacteriaceae bacterium]|jgi:large subunit ribosomal protein L35|nr:50S ribosomal protein L35 [Propionibacteriaceae bacterium]
MPKMKTNTGAKKRFKVTGTGKLVHRQAGKGHLNEHKSSRRTRRLMVDDTLKGADARNVRRMLGI